MKPISFLSKIKPTNLSYLPSVKTIEGRNELFPFMSGLLLVAGGSASTIYYYLCAVFVIFLNPRLGVKELCIYTKRLYAIYPILLVLPLFVFSLFAFSISRSNQEELLSTIASHFQLLFIVPLVVGIHSISKNHKSVSYFIDGLCTGTFLILPVAILQIFVFETRPEGLSGNSLIFAFGLCIACVSGLLQKKEVLKQSLYFNYASSICALFMVIISYSRAPTVLALILIFIAIIILLLSKRIINYKNFITLFSICTVSLVIGVSAIISTDTGAKYFEKRIITPISDLNEGKLSDKSIGIRLNLNISGIHALLENPFLGYGLQNTVETANLFSERALGKQTNYSYSHLHNEYLTYAVTGGFIVLIQYLLILIIPIIIGYTSPLKEFSVLISISFALIALTNVVLGHDIMSTFFSLCVIIILLQRLNDSELSFAT